MPESALGAGDDETVLASFACFAAGGARGAAGAGASAEALAAFGALALALAAGALRFFGADRSGTTEDASASALASAAVTAPSAKKAAASGASQFGATWPNVSRQAKTSLSPPSLHATQSFGVHSEATAQQRREGRAAATESPDDFDCFRGIVGGVGSRMAAVREGGAYRAGSRGERGRRPVVGGSELPHTNPLSRPILYLVVIVSFAWAALGQVPQTGLLDADSERRRRKSKLTAMLGPPERS